jgi:pimeloyl-ACP methyl ester carboxylesterase
MPGRLISMRLRARVVARWRHKPYPLAELAHGFKGISDDPALLGYLAAQADPQVAWGQSVRSVASLFAHNPPRPSGGHAPLVVLSGADDKIIPGWATRGFVRWAGLKPRAVQMIPGAGHMLFHDHLAQTLPVVLKELRLLEAGVR